MVEEDDFNDTMDDIRETLQDADLTGEEWECIESIVMSDDRQGELLASILEKAVLAGGIAELRPRI